ncbi:xanthine dehydrogenase family protein molybdopterin-binding subunit [Rhodovulum sulfidophilum]|uniref:xanthine dehydrogenase family protein molybdopterin-binding subunit n=1 Tax=Rhodovulum sulfidophilum TaxID=35806 RepID=UPI0019250139|nr:xanthine dehydrogenase family protein molybdopterin-binding subunit [Rhodovulum sulfidophilum]MBL3561225.1 xanthine dehydrogenase family protein molybdopterin-binding subunit [Rhodovulum sulfidophilum]
MERTFGKSQTGPRFEDWRFLTGTGRYVDDIAPASALHAVFLRSPVAHAEIRAMDLEDARAAPGVVAVLAAGDLRAAGIGAAMGATVVTNRDGSAGAAPARPLLAEGRVRFVGEAMAVVIAETLLAAKDAAERIVFDLHDLDPHLALTVGGPQIHPEAPLNLAYDWATGDEAAVHEAFRTAARTVRLEVADNRVIVNSMEPRGAWAEWAEGRLHLCVNGQGVWDQKAKLAAMLDLPETAVRVTNPDVGGGFGMKAMSYPEYYVIAHAARALGRPVRWMSDRTEAMLSDNAGRDLVSMVEIAFDAGHRITGYRVETLSNLGAYNSEYAQPIQSELFAKVLTGAYDIPAAFLAVKGVYTNTTQVDAYRGAGRPEAIYALERTMDLAARELGLDPWELRRRNFIAPSAFPYRTPTGESYDVGDFARVLARVETMADRAGFAARKAGSAARGRLRGLGLCYYIESILGDPTEGAEIAFPEDGTVALYVGTQSNGQGHETVYARFLAEQAGLPVEAIRVIQGDSDLIARGGGTGGSRSVTTQASATLAAIEVMVEAFTPFLAAEMGVELSDLGFDEGRFRAPGSNLTPGLIEAAAMARRAGRTDLLRHRADYTLPGRSYPNGAHVAEVEIDPETGETRVLRYTVADDFGTLINPRLAEGQVHGGVAQGLGQALCERVVHDDYGQLLTASFMDYAMPRAADLPFVQFGTEPVPSTANPLGMKGCGEAGTVGAMAAVGNAVLDALWSAGVRRADMPFTPERVWRLLQAAA